MICMRMPSIAEVAKGLRDINANVEGECDVRLCVWSDSQWCLRSGSVDYDQSHSDYCGASGVPGVVRGHAKRFDSVALAKYLIEQCQEQRVDDVES